MSSVIAAPSLAHDAPLSDADLHSLHAWRAANYLSVGQTANFRIFGPDETASNRLSDWAWTN